MADRPARCDHGMLPCKKRRSTCRPYCMGTKGQGSTDLAAGSGWRRGFCSRWTVARYVAYILNDNTGWRSYKAYLEQQIAFPAGRYKRIPKLEKKSMAPCWPLLKPVSGKGKIESMPLRSSAQAVLSSPELVLCLCFSGTLIFNAAALFT